MGKLTDAEKRFLSGLTKLSRETGVVIGGCGCCGSPFIGKMQEDERDGHYECEDNGDCVSWEKPKSEHV